MHELSVVLSIIDIATDAVTKAAARQVDAIELDIGTMAGVERTALDFAWPLAVRDTVLANAERIINEIPAIAKCSRCNCQFDASEIYQACPNCGEVVVQYTQGKELRVKSLVVS